MVDNLLLIKLLNLFKRIDRPIILDCIYIEYLAQAVMVLIVRLLVKLLIALA